MKPYNSNIVTFHVLLAGYEEAVERFDQLALTQDAGRVFAPLFEALNWAVVLDDQARRHYAPEGDPIGWAWRDRVVAGDFVGAVRCARTECTTSGPMP